ncbi:hypothetical protein M8C21_003737, partial [Ambrosia artemisiifolia]
MCFFVFLMMIKYVLKQHQLLIVEVSLGIGSLVWVEDPKAWIDGEVIEVKDNDIKVAYTSGKI